MAIESPNYIKITEIIDKYKEIGNVFDSNKPIEILAAVFKCRLHLYARRKCGWKEDDSEQGSIYSIDSEKGVHKLTISSLPKKLDIYVNKFLEGMYLWDEATLPFEPDSSPVKMEDLSIRKDDVQTLINFFNDPRPEKLILANNVWQECFADGINIPDNQEKYFSQMEIAKEGLKKHGINRKTPLVQLASLICNDRTTKKIKESKPATHNDNISGHPFYALELDIANQCWNELFGNGQKPNYKKGPKNFIQAWLNKNYQQLNNNAVERIVLAVNPQFSGAPPKI